MVALLLCAFAAQCVTQLPPLSIIHGQWDSADMTTNGYSRSCVLVDSPKGKSYELAKQLHTTIVFAKDNPDISPYDFIVIICSNTGDEELTYHLECYLISLKVMSKKYALCELGNYFGMERDCFGSKKIVRYYLAKLGWVEYTHASVDAFPELDMQMAELWMYKTHEAILHNKCD